MKIPFASSGYRKGSALPAVQASQIGITDIRDNVIMLPGEHMCGVLRVRSVAGGLSNEEEQEAILEGYRELINSLLFHVQVLVRVTMVDMAQHISYLEQRIPVLTEELAMLGRSQAMFLRQMTLDEVQLDRSFYLVIPAGNRTARFPFWRKPASIDHEEQIRQLTARCDALYGQLGRCELVADRLDDIEIARLLHSCWCADRANTQRIRGNLAEYTVLIAHSTSEGRQK